MSTRKFFVGGNWKCNLNNSSIEELVETLNKAELDADVEILVSPSFVYLQKVKGSLRDNIHVSAQNCGDQIKGAFTGEVSPAMLKDIGIQWTLTGHSERRHVYGESNELIATKSALAIENGLSVVFCIGEKLETREANQTEQYLQGQLEAFAAKVKDWSNVVVAYEPVWAIGTGKTASPAQAQEAHHMVRSWVASNVSADVAAALRIIYGGSVKPANCKELGAQDDIDGFLVGGCSLTADFIPIVNARK